MIIEFIDRLHDNSERGVVLGEIVSGLASCEHRNVEYYGTLLFVRCRTLGGFNPDQTRFQVGLEVILFRGGAPVELKWTSQEVVKFANHCSAEMRALLADAGLAAQLYHVKSHPITRVACGRSSWSTLATQRSC